MNNKKKQQQTIKHNLLSCPDFTDIICLLVSDSSSITQSSVEKLRWTAALIFKEFQLIELSKRSDHPLVQIYMHLNAPHFGVIL